MKENIDPSPNAFEHVSLPVDVHSWLAVSAPWLANQLAALPSVQDNLHAANATVLAVLLRGWFEHPPT